MLRFLYFTDLHFFDRTPPARSDDYLEAGLRKLDRLISYAREHNVNAILCGGDVFGTKVHAKQLGWDAWYRIAERIGSTYIKEPREPRINWYFNVGQHDMDAHRPESVWGMPLGALAMVDNVYILPNGSPMLVAKGDVSVWFMARWFDFHGSKTPEFYAANTDEVIEEWHPGGVKVDEKDILVFTAHGLLVDQPFVGPHVLVESVGKSRADLFLASDYHPGWPPRRLNGTQYIAPGSFMRPERTDRLPTFLDIALPSVRGGDITWKGIRVDDGHPFKDSAPKLDREHVERDEPLGVAGKLIEESSGISFVNPTERIAQLADERGSSDEVRRTAMDLIGRAQKEVE